LVKFFSSLKSNIYVKQIATLVSGTFVGQLIMLLAMPILTRLYTPDEFGAYSLYISVISIVGLVSSLKYDQAIMLPKSNSNAFSLLTLSLLIIATISLLAALVVLIFADQITNYFSDHEHLLYLIPLGIFLIGVVQAFTAYSSRHCFYKQIAGARISNSISVTSLPIISKWLLNFNGLVIARLVADSLNILILLRKHITEKTLYFSLISKKRLRLNALRYINFPKYQSISVFLNSVSQNMPVILLGLLYSPAIAGLYALAERILRAPVGLIGASTKEVYYQTASRRYINGENILSLYVKTTVGLAKLIIVPLIIILLFGDSIFELLFGEEWSASGNISQLIIIWVFFLFINSPTMVTFNILHKQKAALALEIGSALLRFASIYAGYLLFESFYASISLYVASSVLINIIAILFIYSKLKELHET
jgi:O-antigen/teichoic acid export membrane protein